MTFDLEISCNECGAGFAPDGNPHSTREANAEAIEAGWLIANAEKNKIRTVTIHLCPPCVERTIGAQLRRLASRDPEL